VVLLKTSPTPQGALVLVDAAAELGGTRVGGGYASDITR
jgi:hypothetical protein